MTMLNFEFASAGRIIFGAGAVSQAGMLAAEMGRRALLVLGVRNRAAEALQAQLAEQNIEIVLYDVTHEPDVPMVEQAVTLARAHACDLVIGFGGGSAVDTAKVAAALSANPGEVRDYLEVIGKALPLRSPGLPCIAIPTTAGTGAEVTRNAVISAPQQRVKVSLRSPFLLPRLALVDPALTLDLPPAVTASTGLDALTQVIEPFVSNAANPLTDGLCREALPRAARSLRRVYFQPDDLEARTDMSLVSLFGGLALANAKLGAVHGFAGVLGGMFGGPHGAICACLLPGVIAANVETLSAAQPDSPARQRFDEIARLLTGIPQARAADGAAWIQAVCADLSVPGLAAYGMTAADIPEVVEKSARASSMKGNPVVLDTAALSKILEAAL
jgi:alcohol dehydrogenase class IV